MGVSLIRLGNACVEGVGCRVWRGVEPPRVEDYPIPFLVATGDNNCDDFVTEVWGMLHIMVTRMLQNTFLLNSQIIRFSDRGHKP